MADWQGMASQLVNIIDPERRFAAGEFENLDDAAWANLLAELRQKSGRDHVAEINQLKAEVASLKAQNAREQAIQKAKAAGLTDAEIARIAKE